MVLPVFAAIQQPIVIRVRIGKVGQVRRVHRAVSVGVFEVVVQAVRIGIRSHWIVESHIHKRIGFPNLTGGGGIEIERHRRSRIGSQIHQECALIDIMISPRAGKKGRIGQYQRVVAGVVTVVEYIIVQADITNREGGGEEYPIGRRGKQIQGQRDRCHSRVRGDHIVTDLIKRAIGNTNAIG